MQNIYGVLGSDNVVIDVSNTERGAKVYATKNGYDRVYVRYSCGYNVALVAIKYKGKWFAPEELPEIENEVITDKVDPIDLTLHDNTGGYSSALCFITKDGGILALSTVQDELKQDRNLFDDENDPQWFIVGSFINWEDQDLVDSHTGQPIPANY